MRSCIHTGPIVDIDECFAGSEKGKTFCLPVEIKPKNVTENRVCQILAALSSMYCILQL